MEAIKFLVVDISEMYRSQLMSFIEHMQSSPYKDQLRKEIDKERERNKVLKARSAQLEKQISSLQKESIGQLKSRLGEVYNATNVVINSVVLDHLKYHNTKYL